MIKSFRRKTRNFKNIDSKTENFNGRWCADMLTKYALYVIKDNHDNHRNTMGAREIMKTANELVISLLWVDYFVFN